jgi:hypothetical protein
MSVYRRKTGILLNIFFHFQGDFFTARRLTHISTQGGTNLHFVKQYSLQLSSSEEDWIDYKENGVLKVCFFAK